MSNAHLVAAMAWMLLVLSATQASGPAVPTEMGGLPVERSLPTTMPELARQTDAHPSLSMFGRHPEVIINGFHAMLLPQVPVGPAPHIPWARPLAGPPLRVLFFSNVPWNFDVAEIIRRLDCQPSHVMLPNRFIRGEFPEAYDGYLSDRAVQALDEPIDLIVTDASISLLHERVGAKVLQRVREGVGLVMVSSARIGGGQRYDYWPAKGAWSELSCAVPPANYQMVSRPVVQGELFAGVPLDAGAGFLLPGMQARSDATVLARVGRSPVALSRQVGQGLVVELMWSSWMGPFPIQELPVESRVVDYHEYYASALIRAMLHATRRPAPVRIEAATTEHAAGRAIRQPLNLTGPVERAKVHALLRNLRGQTLQTVEQPARAQVELPLAPLPAGEYLLDLIVRNEKGQSLGWATWPLVVKADVQITVNGPETITDVEQPATFTAQMQGDAPAGSTVRWRAWDALDRVVIDHATPVTKGAATIAVQFRPVTTYHWIEATLLTNGQPTAQSIKTFTFPRFDWGGFTNMLWPGYAPEYAQKRVLRRFRETLGFQTLMAHGLAGTQQHQNELIAQAGSRLFWTNTAVITPNEFELEPQRVRDVTEQELRKTGDQIRRLGAMVVYSQDERHAMRDPGRVTPAALAEFRNWLKGRYKDVAELNAAWNRSYPSFDEVQPLLTADYDASKEASLAPWLEWRLWVMDAIASLDRRNAALTRELVGQPRLHFGVEGIFPIQNHVIPFGGIDVAAQAVAGFDAGGPYGEETLNLMRSFLRGPMHGWGGYFSTMPQYDRYVWSGVLQGHWGTGWFCGQTFYNAFDWWMPQAAWIERITRPAITGVGDLLLANQPIRSEPIAFLYSQPSLYAMSALGKRTDPTNNHFFVRPTQWARESLQRMFMDQGVQFGYVSEQQVQDDQIGDVKVLVLTACVALDPATSTAIARFVERGGIVIADLPAGVFDHRGMELPEGSLNALFGVRRTGPFRISTAPLDWGVGVMKPSDDGFDARGWYIGQYFDPQLEVSDGQALGEHIFGPRKVPALVFKRSGKGAAILMNWLETEYRRVPESYQQVLAAALLKYAGIEPAVRLRDTARGGEPINSGIRISRWIDGQAHYVGILMDNGRTVEVDLPVSGHVYELIRGEALGQGQTVTLDLRDRPHALLAILPQPVAGVSAKVDPVKLGQDAHLRLELSVDDAPIKRVVHVSVQRPDGSPVHWLSRNVTFVGRTTSTLLPIALTDPTGRWTVTARETVSGKSAVVTLKVSGR